jgi:ubiquitin C-terminal hydrolase
MAQIYQEYFTANPGVIDSLFTGINRSVVQCASCDHQSITYKPFSAMSLGLESSLENSIKESFKVSKFDSENKYKCEKCSKKTQAKHYVKICYLP